MTTTERLKRDLNSTSLENRIDKIIHTVQPVLYDMILFAEYLERKHKRGYVVYWCTAGVPRFEVSTVEEYYASNDKPWYGASQWHTNLAYHKVFSEE